MSHKDHKTLKLDNTKSCENKLLANNVKTGSKMEPKRQRCTSTLNRNYSSKNQNTPNAKLHKSKLKIDNPLSLCKSEHKTEKTAKRKRLISQLVPKQSDPRQNKSLYKKQVKYIFNSIPNNRVHVPHTIKAPNSTLVSHSKCFSNQTILKDSYRLKNDALSSFGKTQNSEFTKIKKKKHDYIKGFNKTQGLEKTLSIGFQSLDFGTNETLAMRHFDRTVISQYPFGLENAIIGLDVTDKDLEGLELSSKVPKLSEIRQNVSNLFKKLKSPSKSKLLLISNNYEKIVSELYTAIVIKKPSLPNCEVSRINTSDQNDDENQNHQPKPQAKNSQQKLTNPNTPFSHKRFQAEIRCSEDSSEHWDSYLNFNSEQFRSVNQQNKQKGKQNLVKKLDLKGIKRPDIKQYQDEFMDMKENFSQSWKREISQQTRF